MEARRPTGSEVRNGIRLGRIADIEVIADWSLLIIFTVIAFGLATGVFPAWHPDWPAALVWGTALGAALDALARRGVNQLPVLEGGRLVGLLRREDVLNWLSLYEGTVEA